MQPQTEESQNDSQNENRIHLIPTRNKSVFNVELRLPHKTVYPGKLDLSAEGCFRAKKKPEQVHEKLNAWGINAELVERFTFKWVSILCGGREYLTSTAVLRRFGKRLTFKNLDTQYFLPITMFGIDMVKELEKREAKESQQLCIFSNIETAWEE